MMHKESPYPLKSYRSIFRASPCADVISCACIFLVQACGRKTDGPDSPLG